MAEIKNLEFVEGTDVTAPTTAILEVGTADAASSLQAVNIAYLSSIGAGLKNNINAAVDPTATDDGPDGGYSVGSMWFNTTASPTRIWIATDVTDDAAVWKHMMTIADAQTITGAKSFSADVTVTDATSATSTTTGALKVTGGISTQENLHVGGDLVVEGATTTLNTATLDVEDANITVNKGGNDASSEGSGLTVERTATDGSLVYEDALTSKFKAGPSGTESEVMTVGTAQTVSGAKTYTAINDHEEALNMKQVTTPANPASGDNRLYFKNDDKLYKLNSSGLEEEVGSGGGGGLDTFYQEDFSAITASDWSTGDNATFMSSPTAGTGGTTGTTTLPNTTSAIREGNDLKYVQASGSLNDYIACPEITIYEKMQNNFVGLVLGGVIYDGDDGDIVAVLYDETNDVVLSDDTWIIEANGGTSKRHVFNVFIPDGVTSLRWGIQTKVENIGASLQIDDVELTTNPFVIADFSNITDFQDYTPGTNGFGTIADPQVRYKQVGDLVYIRGYFQSGTTTAVEARIDLPNGYTASDNTASFTPCGMLWVDGSRGLFCIGYTSSSQGYVKLGYHDRSANTDKVAAQNASTIVPSSTYVHFEFAVEVQELTSKTEHIVTPTRMAQPASANTADTTPISSGALTFIGFTTDFDDDGLFVNSGSTNNTTHTSTTYYLVPRDGKFRVGGQVYSTDTDIDSDERLDIIIAVNGVEVKKHRYESFASLSVPAIAWAINDIVSVSKDDKISIAVNTGTVGAITLDATASLGWFTVEQVDTVPVLGAIPGQVQVYYSGNGGESITGDTTDVTWDDVTVDSHSAWDGNSFTAPETGLYHVEGAANHTTSAARTYKAYVDGVHRANFFRSQSGEDIVYFSGAVYLLKNEVFSMRASTSSTLSDSTLSHWIAISRR